MHAGVMRNPVRRGLCMAALSITAGLSSIAATVANLLGLEKHEKWDESLLEIK